MDSTALLSHLLGRLTHDLEFLHAQRLLSTADLDQIKAKLPSPHSTPDTIASGSSGALEGGLAHLSLGGGESTTAGGGAPLGTARALWDYTQSQWAMTSLPAGLGDEALRRFGMERKGNIAVPGHLVVVRLAEAWWSAVVQPS